MTLLQIDNATLLDPATGTLTPDATLVAEDGVIRQAGAEAGIGEADMRLDAAGKVVMPGLIDAHVHSMVTTLDFRAMSVKPIGHITLEASKVLKGMLARGFTSVRDAGGADWTIATAITRGLIEGPRLYYSGRTISQTGGHGDQRPFHEDPPVCACGSALSGISHVVDGVEAVRTAVRQELRHGATQIKLMASGGVASPTDPLLSLQMSPEEMRVATQEAQDWGTYTMAHAYAPAAIIRCVEAGVRSIEHGNLLDAEAAIAMAGAGTFLVPTLVTYHALNNIGRQMGFPARSLEKLTDVLDAGLRSLELARDHDIPMVFGTDLLGEAHPQQNEEFAIRAEVLKPLDLIQAATTTAAVLLQAEGTLGTLAEGAHADLLILNGNPLDDISVLAKPETGIDTVIKAGSVVAA